MGSRAEDGEDVAVGEEDDVDVPEGGQLRKEGSQFIPSSMVPPKTHSIRMVHAALVLVQLGYAGLQMFSRVALDAGLNQFLLSMYRNMIAFGILGPVAYYYERLELSHRHHHPHAHPLEIQGVLGCGIFRATAFDCILIPSCPESPQFSIP
jgi:hypothetical protein